jgi:ectoine hydroxylase-related dioxygenase (phytanoyl-CoA dioxygenase family)
MYSASQIIFTKAEFESQDSTALLQLRANGIIVVQEFYGSAQLAELNKEFDSLLNSSKNYVEKLQYSEGSAVKFRTRELEVNEFPALSKSYSAAFMQRLTEEYFDARIRSNVTIFAVKDVVGSKHIANDLHFDVKRSLKFFIYLTNTTADNGAFYCVPGSFKNAADIRLKYGNSISYDNTDLTRDLPFTDSDAIPIEGKAGTLIVFDTDVFHKAGTVHHGERRVLRGQSSYYNFQEPAPSIWKRMLKKLNR